MQFLSFPFGACIVLLLILYWGVPRRGFQNFLLLAFTLVFVGSFSPLALAVLLLATVQEWGIARALLRTEQPSRRLAWLWTSVLSNFAVLAFFRYHHFFAPELKHFILPLGATAVPVEFLAPVGVSFWLLQKTSLTFDIYFQRMTVVPSLARCITFVGFFPNLVSGPIERARNFLPQLEQARVASSVHFSQAVWLFVLGAFKKVVLADNLGLVASDLLGPDASGVAVVLGIWAYALQIWGDFAGYSDMARGTALLFGIQITENFLSPYAARDISDYWRRWHVSFSSWLSDTLYAPASFWLRNMENTGIVLATWITFLVSGIWHGNGWNYVAWGSVHAGAMSVFLLTKKKRKKLSKKWGDPWWIKALAIALTFHVVCLGYVFFRAPSLGAAFEQLGALVGGPLVPAGFSPDWATLVLCTMAVVGLHVVQLRTNTQFWVFKMPLRTRVAFYAVLLFVLVRFYAPAETFIYFQF